MPKAPLRSADDKLPTPISQLRPAPVAAEDAAGLAAAGAAAARAAVEKAGLSLPLRTAGRWIVGADGRRVKLACGSWTGFDQRDMVANGLDRQPLATIVGTVRDTLGMNCVRIPFSNEMMRRNPVAPAYAVPAAVNPGLAGRRALQVLDGVVAGLTGAGLMVVLDNHMSDADWCCYDDDNNGLWYNDRFSEDEWITDWLTLAHRYRNNSLVVGAELRNEPRSSVVGGERRKATWGTGDPETDLLLAYTRCGEAVRSHNPHWLLMLDGPQYALV